MPCGSVAIFLEFHYAYRVMIRLINLRRANSIVLTPKSSAFSASAASLPEQLSFFPEYAKVQEWQSSGSFNLMIPELERMHDVLQHNAGSTSSMTLYVVRQMAEAARLSGDDKKAGSILAASMEQLNEGPEKVHLLALRSYQGLVQGGEFNFLAELDAREAIRMAESYEGIHPDYLGMSYGLLGVAHSLVGGEYDMAEEYLQLSARWSQEPVAEMCALNNLGFHHFYCNNTPENERRDARFGIIEGTTMWEEGATTNKKNSSSEVEEVPAVAEGVKEALAIWEEALGGYKEADGDGNGGLLNTDVDYAVAYAGVLTATAQGYKNRDPVRSAEVLASALKAVDKHQGNPKARPMLGRILSLIAFNNMSASLAVTAEGLFRSSLDHLNESSPYATHDVRYTYERGLTLGGYGLLASKWEKREKDAEKLQKEAKAILSRHGNDSHCPFPFLFPDIANLEPKV